MLVFPQLSSGALAQFPIQTLRLKRTITNAAADGSRVVLSDPNQSTIEWHLKYAGLSDAEQTTLVQFFESTEGSLQTFLFPDPAGNLFAQSETLNQSVWQANSLLTIQANIKDPLGTTRATRLTNTSAGVLTLAQTIAVPGTLTCCFSIYVRSDRAGSVTLTRTSGGNVSSATFAAGTSWQRKWLTGSATNGGTSSAMAIVVPAGESIDVFGMQVDGQNAPSEYMQTLVQSGVYTAARFQRDTLTITADAPNRSSCTLSIVANG